MGQGLSLSRLGGGIGTRDRVRRNLRRIVVIFDRVLMNKETTCSCCGTPKRYRERRKDRQKVFQVSLIGYTNAGNRHCFNRLTEANTFEENLLFATLDPTTRKMPLLSGYTVLLTDTVGFIQDLPTSLIAAFRSTLEEVGKQMLFTCS